MNETVLAVVSGIVSGLVRGYVGGTLAVRVGVRVQVGNRNRQRTHGTNSPIAGRDLHEK